VDNTVLQFTTDFDAVAAHRIIFDRDGGVYAVLFCELGLINFYKSYH
jgi:hypothetical protein